MTTNEHHHFTRKGKCLCPECCPLKKVPTRGNGRRKYKIVMCKGDTMTVDIDSIKTTKPIMGRVGKKGELILSLPGGGEATFDVGIDPVKSTKEPFEVTIK